MEANGWKRRTRAQIYLMEFRQRHTYTTRGNGIEPNFVWLASAELEWIMRGACQGLAICMGSNAHSPERVSRLIGRKCDVRATAALLDPSYLARFKEVNEIRARCIRPGKACPSARAPHLG